MPPDMWFFADKHEYDTASSSNIRRPDKADDDYTWAQPVVVMTSLIRDLTIYCKSTRKSECKHNMSGDSGPY